MTTIFPSISSVGWGVKRSPVFATIASKHVSGKVARASYGVWPLWKFELVYDVLLSDPATAWLQTLRGFFEAQNGQLTPFYFQDPEFYNNYNQVLGTGNGSQTDFTFVRSVGSYYTEPVNAVATLVKVYLNGVVQSSGYSLVTSGPYPVLRFTTAPASGVQVMADFTYYFLCRFVGDVHDYEEFMKRMHTLQSCAFITVKP